MPWPPDLLAGTIFFPPVPLPPLRGALSVVCGPFKPSDGLHTGLEKWLSWVRTSTGRRDHK